MTPKEFRRYLDRDFGRCWHCGLADDTLIPQHRINRGMGSVKSRNKPANIIVLCSAFNQLIEANPNAAAQARKYGWKLNNYQKPEFEPVWDINTQSWWMLDNDYGRVTLLP